MTRALFFRAGLAASLLIAATPACRETIVSRYASADEVRRAGAVERGWVPALLPSAATEIYEAHNVDTNETCGSFRVPADDLPAWVSEHVERMPLESGRPNARPASWCREIPDWMRFERDIFAAGERTMTVARLEGKDSTLIGVDVNGGRVFFWVP